MSDKVHIGIDVSEAWLDIAIHGERACRRLANTAADITAWIDSLPRERVHLICYEPTGGYERCLARLLRSHGLPALRVHPNEVVAFRQCRGIKAKTDRQDARLLAEFATLERHGEALGQAVVGDTPLRELSVRRRQLIAQRTAEACRLAMTETATVKAGIERMIGHLDAEIATIEAELRMSIVV